MKHSKSKPQKKMTMAASLKAGVNKGLNKAGYPPTAGNNEHHPRRATYTTPHNKDTAIKNLKQNRKSRGMNKKK